MVLLVRIAQRARNGINGRPSVFANRGSGRAVDGLWLALPADDLGSDCALWLIHQQNSIFEIPN
jgi:hypothetical protein